MATSGSISSTEREIVEQVAARLAGEGYDVVVEPGPSELPPDLARLRPDIMARAGDETLIVEVKRQRSPRDREHVEALARAVQQRPNWHFELVIAPSPEPAKDWSREEIAARVAESLRLLQSGHPEAAILLLWAAAEATARRLAVTEKVAVRRWAPGAMFRQLVHAGLLDQEDLEAIEEARAVRNCLVHGLAPDGDAVRSATRLAAVVSHMLEPSVASRK